MSCIGCHLYWLSHGLPWLSNTLSVVGFYICCFLSVQVGEAAWQEYQKLQEMLEQHRRDTRALTTAFVDQRAKTASGVLVSSCSAAMLFAAPTGTSTNHFLCTAVHCCN